MRLTRIVLAVLLSATSLAPRPAWSQGVMAASVVGTVTTDAGRPLPGALVTLTALGRRGSQEATTSPSGAYAFPLIAPGSYEIRAEAIGYRPVVARTLMLGGGERGSVALVLTAVPPPVLTVDTVVLRGTATSRWRLGGTRLGPGEIDDLPHRFEDLNSLAAMSSASDASLGSQGLPGGMTLLIADGVPFYRAAHTLSRADQLAGPLFGRGSLGSVTIQENAPDIESWGSAGGYVSGSTRSGTSGGRLELEGSWSGAPLWSSGQLDFETPSLTSLQVGGRSTLVVSPGTSQIVIGGDVFRQDAPLGPRIDGAVGAGLAGLDAALIDELSAPSVERLSRYSTQMRFDGSRGTTGQIFLRAGAAYTQREFAGSGPLTLARDAILPEEGLDFSAAGGWTTEYRPGIVFDLRAGLSGSDRSFESPGAQHPSAYLANSGRRLGLAPGTEADAARVDFVILPGVHWSVGTGLLKLGLSARVTSHSLTQHPWREYFYSDEASLVAGQGVVASTDAHASSFATREFGGYAQYELEPTRALTAWAGIRYDREMIPTSGVTQNADWLQLSGLPNDTFPSTFGQFGAVAAFTWDPALDGSTLVFGALTVHHGDVDPGALAELFSDEGRTLLQSGPGFDWPMETLPGATVGTLTLFGPDVRPPQSMRSTLGIVRRLTAGWNVHLGAAYRRTDFLLRRRNLNRPAVAGATDAYGRDVFGTLQQTGVLVSATGVDVRRLAGFGDVWALDPDGWSEYWDLTGGLQYSSNSTSLSVSYTRSETSDNWVGASSGRVDAQLSPALPGPDDWSEGTSDFDVPDRIVAAGSTRLSAATLSAVYRFRSGLPFTPRYRAGVDANGDGSLRNDVAWVDATLVDPLLSDWKCLSDSVGAFAARNSCRGSAAHSLDVRLSFRLGQVMGRDASLVIDGLDLIETRDGIVDDALLLVDPAGTLTGAGGTVTIPVIVNPDFGAVAYPSSRGRMLRIGFRIG